MGWKGLTKPKCRVKLIRHFYLNRPYGRSFYHKVVEPFFFRPFPVNPRGNATVFQNRGVGPSAKRNVLKFRERSAGVYFINMLRSPFSYKSALGRFSLVTVWLCNFLGQEYWRKSCSKTCKWNWLQHRLQRKLCSRAHAKLPTGHKTELQIWTHTSKQIYSLTLSDDSLKNIDKLTLICLQMLLCFVIAVIITTKYDFKGTLKWYATIWCTKRGRRFSQSVTWRFVDIFEQNFNSKKAI